MNGAQFVWVLFAVGFAWIVFQRACGEARSRAERIRVARSIADKSAGWNVAMERLEAEYAAAESRRATIAQASYWP